VFKPKVELQLLTAWVGLPAPRTDLTLLGRKPAQEASSLLLRSASVLVTVAVGETHSRPAGGTGDGVDGGEHSSTFACCTLERFG